MRKKTWSSILFAIALTIGLSGLVLGQDITGAIVGTVKDTSGAVVPGGHRHYQRSVERKRDHSHRHHERRR